MRDAQPRVVIVGAGFGGMEVARGLRHAPAEILLVDKTNHTLFQPLLYQVATAALAPSDIASPIRAAFSGQANVEVIMGEVTGVDVRQRHVSIRGLADVAYDYLVIATGASPSWFGRKDWEQHSTGLKSLSDAATIRKNLLGAFEQAERSFDKGQIDHLLTFIVVGGGASGVELAGSIRDLSRTTLARDFKRVQPQNARILLFEGSDTLLAGFPEKLSRYARTRLEKMGVEVHTGVQVEQVDADGVVAGGKRTSGANVFWCAGVQANAAASWIGAATGRHGSVKVGPDCSVPGHPDIFAIGDIADFEVEPGKFLPGLAPVAKQQGRFVADTIAARLRRITPSAHFHYRDNGSLAVIGRSAAVASLPHLKMTGFPAWLLWSCVHIATLAGFREKSLVYLQWVSAWLFHSRGARLIDSDIAPSGPVASSGINPD